MEKSMEKESTIIILEENTKVNGSTIKSMVMGLLTMSMEISMKDTGKMDRDLVKVFMNIQMVISMKANG